MKELSNQERLELITAMIHQAKSSVAKGGSKQILLWGWVIALANLSHFALEQMDYSRPYIVWLITIPTAVYSTFLGMKLKAMPASGHIGRMYGQVWLAIGVMIILTLLMMNQVGYHHNPVIIGIAGGGMYITGRLLRFRPVLIGAFVLWFASFVETQLPIDYHYLVSGIAIVLGYLIPGYLLKRAEK